MKLLFIGDIVGAPGRKAIRVLLPKLKKRYSIDLSIANGENAAGGSGITPRIAEELFGYGLNMLTSGDHIWKKKEILEIIDSETRILRPLNYPKGSPGAGFGIIKTKKGKSVGVINLEGRVFMSSLDCPFRCAEQALEEIKKETKIILVDIHAEATSEKIALGWFLDGTVSAVLGTHTHVQTADERILPKGTAYITDLGMTGPYDSVIGRKVDQILARFLSQMPVRFEMASEDIQLHGVVLDIDEKTGKANSIERIQEKLKESRE
ncbi:MAG: TIGR00282 family metallophosphoesterase [Candidatus Omnitrophica bacterium]|nr:TIGR00282 family metallophosphoesterase [Candidatus Omnitrophota bacterium]